MRLLALALLLACGARAQDVPTEQTEGQAVDGDQSAASAEMRRQLESDPGLVEALVERISRSRIGNVISKELNVERRNAEIRQWVNADLGGAADLALGFAKDDANGNMLFENSLYKQLSKTYTRNNDGRGAYGVLKDAARKSKTIKGADEDVSDEQRREMLKNLFEGKGSQSERTVTGSADKGGAPPGSQAAPALANSFYDRLSAGNIRGYSPQLMAFQSSLNQRRPPGAPLLIETGKLDHATLSYPAFGLKYDLGNLEERMRRERINQLAALGGVTLGARDWQDPGLEARLLARVPADKLPKRFSSRAAAIAKAKAALDAFESAAAAAKDPNAISKRLLVELGGRQREAARWLTAAALEEELGRVENDEGFLTPELLAAIDAVPAPAPAKAAYKLRGEGYKTRLETLRANALAGIAALEREDWLSRVPLIEKAIADNQALRKTLSRDIADYRVVPFKVAEAVHKQARWREILDNLAVKYASSTSYAKEVSRRRGRLSRSLNAFALIAQGDVERARTFVD